MPKRLRVPKHPMAEQPKIKILFLCTGNSCRSQMAEGWARHLAGDTLEPFSAGTAPHGLDPRAVQVMAEAGVDISNHQSKGLDNLKGIEFSWVITVCDRARESCPVFPGAAGVTHRSFPDPPAMAAAEQDPQRQLDHYRSVRDQIRDFVAGLPAMLSQGPS